ncbi:MAG: hypothetical protein SPI74_00445 [Eubacterium sp.]|nr:hypothetical protein [Eubacterium sp.]
MKQIITATASLILILTVFSYVFEIQEIKLKQTQAKLCSIKYIEMIKVEGNLTDKIKDEWIEKIGQIYNCGKDSVSISFNEEVLSNNRLIDIYMEVANVKGKDLTEAELKNKNIKLHFIVKCKERKNKDEKFAAQCCNLGIFDTLNKKSY